MAGHCHVGNLLHGLTIDVIDVRLGGVNLYLSSPVGIYMAVFIHALGEEAAAHDATLNAPEWLDDGDVE